MSAAYLSAPALFPILPTEIGGGRGNEALCVERTLRYAPYPGDAAGHRRVRVELTNASPALEANPF